MAPSHLSTLVLCLALAATTAAPAAASQSLPLDLAPLARQLAPGMAQPGTARIAVLPVADALDRYDTASLRTLTDRLGAALRSEAQRRGELWVVIGATDVDRVLAELRLPPPIGPAGAALAGGLLAATHVVLAQLDPVGRESRLAAELLEVSTRRVVIRAEADVPVTATSIGRPALAAATAPPRGYWTGRRLAMAGGIAGAAAAATIALLKNEQVQDARDRLLAVPPGASDEFNREARAARQAERTRDFWWGAALGVSGVTIAYLMASDSPNQRPQPAPVVSVPIPGKWLIEVHPAALRVRIGRGF